MTNESGPPTNVGSNEGLGVTDEARGTFACPICGYDKPHSHTDAEQAAYREDQMRNDGWTSTAKRQPKQRGWYLCCGIDVPFKHATADDGYSAQERSSQLDWFLWVRSGAFSFNGLGSPSKESEIPEVLYFDGLGWSLRNLLGNAVMSGAESRWRVRARPTYWREIPPVTPNAKLTCPPRAGHRGDDGNDER